MTEVLEKPRTELESSSIGAPAQAEAQTPAQTEAQALTRLLTGVMALGQMNGMRGEVGKILVLLNEMVVDRSPLLINLAMASAVMGDGSMAETLLSEGVEHWPDAEMATISLATALQLVGDLQWLTHVERLLATSADPRVRELAETMLLAHNAGGQ
jgi:Flp pilus assembly protein TadD